MQATKGPNGTLFPPEQRVRPISRAIAIALALVGLGCGVAGLMFLSQDTWGVGLIEFGCLLAILSVAAQAAEHFARAKSL
jgi:hypothetical protein